MTVARSASTKRQSRTPAARMLHRNRWKHQRPSGSRAKPNRSSFHLSLIDYIDVLRLKAYIISIIKPYYYFAEEGEIRALLFNIMTSSAPNKTVRSNQRLVQKHDLSLYDIKTLWDLIPCEGIVENIERLAFKHRCVYYYRKYDKTLQQLYDGMKLCFVFYPRMLHAPFNPLKRQSPPFDRRIPLRPFKRRRLHREGEAGAEAQPLPLPQERDEGSANSQQNIPHAIELENGQELMPRQDEEDGSLTFSYSYSESSADDQDEVMEEEEEGNVDSQGTLYGESIIDNEGEPVTRQDNASDEEECLAYLGSRSDSSDGAASEQEDGIELENGQELMHRLTFSYSNSDSSADDQDEVIEEEEEGSVDSQGTLYGESIIDNEGEPVTRQDNASDEEECLAYPGPRSDISDGAASKQGDGMNDSTNSSSSSTHSSGEQYYDMDVWRALSGIINQVGERDGNNRINVEGGGVITEIRHRANRDEESSSVESTQIAANSGDDMDGSSNSSLNAPNGNNIHMMEEVMNGSAELLNDQEGSVPNDSMDDNDDILREFSEISDRTLGRHWSAELLNDQEVSVPNDSMDDNDDVFRGIIFGEISDKTMKRHLTGTAQSLYLGEDDSQSLFQRQPEPDTAELQNESEEQEHSQHPEVDEVQANRSDDVSRDEGSATQPTQMEDNHNFEENMDAADSDVDMVPGINLSEEENRNDGTDMEGGALADNSDGNNGSMIDFAPQSQSQSRSPYQPHPQPQSQYQPQPQPEPDTAELQNESEEQEHSQHPEVDEVQANRSDDVSRDEGSATQPTQMEDNHNFEENIDVAASDDIDGSSSAPSAEGHDDIMDESNEQVAEESAVAVSAAENERRGRKRERELKRLECTLDGRHWTDPPTRPITIRT